MGRGLRLLAKIGRIGLAEQRLRGLDLAAVGPRAGAAEGQPQSRERKRAPGGDPGDMSFPLSR